MKKKTTKTKLTKNCLIIMMATIIVILGAIGAIISTRLKDILICIGISGLGIIIFDFARLFLYLEIDKRDKLD